MTPDANDRRFRLLLMSVGSLVSTGLLEIIEAIGRKRFELIGINSEAAATNNFRVDVCYLSPPAKERRDLFALLDEVVRRHDPELIVPTRDDDVVALAHWSRTRRSSKVMVGSVLMAEVIRDKWNSYQWALKNNLPWARSAIDEAGAARLLKDVGFPLISKPREGFGSNGVRMLLSEDHLRAALDAGGQVIQEAIDPSPMLTPQTMKSGMPLWFAPIQPGSPCTLCFIDDEDVKFLAAWKSWHIRGASMDSQLLQDASFEEMAMEYARTAWRDGWRGLLNVQARRNSEGKYVPIELAGRFIGTTSALHKLGVPVMSIVFQRFIESFDLEVRFAPRFDVRAVKQVATYLVTREEEETLQKSGVWQRG